MNTIKTILSIVVFAAAASFAASCEGNKQESEQEVEGQTEMNHENMSGSNSDNSSSKMKTADEASEVIINKYLELKDALVADNGKQSAEAGRNLSVALRDFDAEKYETGQQQELKQIIDDAKEHADHIWEGNIGHQREHFLILSKNIADFIAITGTSNTLYQQYCPMYNDNEGGMWLSASEEIRNPYFGAKMLKCGEVQREIK